MPTLLLHGLGATSGVWRGYDGLAPHLPGHGSASWEASYDFDRHAEAVLPLLGEEPTDVIGHSMGEWWVLRWPCARPRPVQ